jgi:hypothetical protein
MDHNVAPLLDALADYHALDRYGFTSPGDRQGRGADPRTRAITGADAFRSDVLATAGLDDWKSSGRYLSRAEELMADAVGAWQAFSPSQLPVGEGRDAGGGRWPGRSADQRGRSQVGRRGPGIRRGAAAVDPAAAW